MSQDLRIRIRFSRPAAIRAALLGLLFGLPGFLQSQLADAPERTVTMNTGFAGPVGAFAQMGVPGNAILARDGGAAIFGDIGAGALPNPLTLSSSLYTAGRAVFGGVVADASAARYDASVNVVGSGGLPAGLVIPNRTVGGRPWVLTAGTLPDGVTNGVMFGVGVGVGAPPFVALGLDISGRIRVGRYRTGACLTNEFPIFSGVAQAGHSPPAAVNVQHTCDDINGCDVTSAGIQHLCVPFRDGW